MQTAAPTANRMLRLLPLLLFGSRWLQLPRYKTFINASNLDVKTMMWQVIIHITFLLSAVAIALIDRRMVASPAEHAEKGVSS